MTLDEQFNIISDKLQLLLKQHHRLQKENERLKEELISLKNGQEAERELLEGLQQQVSILKVSQGTMPEKDRKEFEKKISQYIREIDRCISYLSQ